MYKPDPDIFYCRLAVKAQSHTGQGQNDRGHGHTNRCYTKHYRHARVCIHGKNPTGISA